MKTVSIRSTFNNLEILFDGEVVSTVDKSIPGAGKITKKLVEKLLDYEFYVSPLKGAEDVHE